MLNAPDYELEAIETRYDAIASDLTETGLSIVQDYFDPALINALEANLNAYRKADELTYAGIGRGDQFKFDLDIRSDKTHWLSPITEAQCQFLNSMESLRIAMNKRLFLGLFEYESHFAYYEQGAFYSKHKDSFRGAANRILSTVTYLNRHWHNDDGGLLVIYHENDEEICRILPEAGTLAIFLSEEIPHEVTPTRRPRSSIAGWFRSNGSSGGDIDPLQ